MEKGELTVPEVRAVESDTFTAELEVPCAFTVEDQLPDAVSDALETVDGEVLIYESEEFIDRATAALTNAGSEPEKVEVSTFGPPDVDHGDRAIERRENRWNAAQELPP